MSLPQGHGGSWPRHAALALAALALAACGRHEAPAPAAAGHANAPPAAASTPDRAEPAPATTASAATTATPSAPAAAGSTAAAPTTADLSVAMLTLGDAVDADYRVRTPATRFAPDRPDLYASVATIGRSAEATLGASWHYLEGQGKAIADTHQAIAPDGPAITVFKLHNPDLWPVGKYRVDITLDGRPVAAREFEVVKDRR